MRTLLFLTLVLKTTQSEKFKHLENENIILLTGGIADADSNYGLSSVEVLGQPSCFVPPLPSPRAAHVTIPTIDNLLLTCGGLLDLDVNFDEHVDLSCVMLDPGSSSWVPHSTLDVPRFGFSAISLEEGVFLLGGTYPSTSNTSSFLPTGATEWQVGPNIPEGEHQDFSCGVAISDHQFLFTFGLYATTTKVLEYDTKTSVWIKWDMLPKGRWGSSCLRVGDNVLIAGGQIADTAILHIPTRTWRNGGLMTTIRRFFGLQSLNDKVLAFGGMATYNDSYVALTSAEEWEPEQEVWAASDIKLETPRAVFGAVSGMSSDLCTPTTE